MKRYNELTPEQQEAAVNHEVNSLLESLVNGLRFDDCEVEDVVSRRRWLFSDHQPLRHFRQPQPVPAAGLRPSDGSRNKHEPRA